ncbi:hydrogenase maturation nickel metallochaperone HypA [bacterium]|nr:hydrogenase maturation nickel metallochaperone HypA [bacterium]
MSIAVGILDIAESEARRADAAVINTIEVEVGALAGIEIPALEFAFEVARRGTLAETATLVVHAIPGRGHCPDCDAEVEIDFAAAVCPACDGAIVTVTSGRELRVRALNVD